MISRREALAATAVGGVMTAVAMNAAQAALENNPIPSAIVIAAGLHST